MNPKTIRKADLESAAHELNILMGLVPKIRTGSQIKKDQLVKELIEASAELVPGDFITSETMDVLKAIEADLPMEV